jgi:hypothetical protein
MPKKAQIEVLSRIESNIIRRWNLDRHAGCAQSIEQLYPIEKNPKGLFRRPHLSAKLMVCTNDDHQLRLGCVSLPAPEVVIDAHTAGVLWARFAARSYAAARFASR